MNVRLTHYGWMVVRQLANTGKIRVGENVRDDFLLDLWTGGLASISESPFLQELFNDGIIEEVQAASPEADTLQRYERNPFEHVEKVILEYTTVCNFNCDHCYNSHVPRITEMDPQLLVDAANIFLRMGIRRFDFVGGEVSRYGNGWLDVVEQIRSHGNDIPISLYTNGWWLEQENFQAAGQTFAGDQAYLSELKRRGLSHVTFSLDGPGDLHDLSRHQAGLYERILRGLEKVKQAGIAPRVSLLIRPEWTDEQVESFLAEPASVIYDLDPTMSPHKRALRLSLDPTNSISNFIDIGNGARDNRMQFPILEERAHALYCRNFYRLSPSLTIKANGELATCRLSQAGEGYGNIHEHSLVYILNQFEEAFVYQLHASRQLEKYLPLVDYSLFGSAFTHLCSLRSIVTILARKMHEQGVSPEDAASVQRINREVAAVTGHLARPISI